MAAANPVLNNAAGPDSPSWSAAVMTVGADYSANPPRFIEIGTAGSYTIVNGDGTSFTYTFQPGTKWLRPQSITTAAGAVLGYW